jgi:hypothetical protein
MLGISRTKFGICCGMLHISKARIHKTFPFMNAAASESSVDTASYPPTMMQTFWLPEGLLVRRILASLSLRSLYSRAFSSETAACDANVSRTAIRAGVNTCDVKLFSRRSAPIRLVCFTRSRQSTDRAPFL